MSDVRATETVREIVQRLASAQKSPRGAPAYSRWVNRPMGRILAAVTYRVGLTPNQVTAISAAFSFCALALLAAGPGGWLIGVLVAVGLVTGYAFDSADGQLARLRGGGSPAGEWLDHMVDATKISTLHLAVMVFLYRHASLNSVWWLLIPACFVVVANTTFFGMILTEQLRRLHGSERSADGSTSALRSLLVIPTDYGLLCLIFVLLWQPVLFFIAYTVIFAGNVLFTVKWIKWFRDLSGQDG